MEFSADTRSELLALFAEILDADARCAGLGAAQRVVGGCQQLRAVLAARDAEFTPVIERLLRDADVARPPAGDDATVDVTPDDDAASADAAASDAHDAGSAQPGDAGDTNGAAGDGAAGLDGGVDGPADEPEPVVTPKESAHERSRRELRAKWMDVFTTFHEALATGKVSPEHADQLARICQALPPWIVAELAADQPRMVVLASTYAADGFATMVGDWIRDVRLDHGISEYEHQLAESRASIWLDRVTGLYHLHAVFDPQRGAVVQDALDQRANQLRIGDLGRRLAARQLAAQALYDLIAGTASVTPRAIVIVDHQTAATGTPHGHTVCENIDGAPLPVGVATDALVNGKITAAILDRAGKPADLAHPEHQATVAQRDELRAMHPRCTHPDCGTPFSRCFMHHVTYWSRQGHTIVSNLVPVCLKHHHDIHDRGWRLTMDDARTCRWYRPDGALYATVPLRRLDRLDPNRPGHADRSRPDDSTVTDAVIDAASTLDAATHRPGTSDGQHPGVTDAPRPPSDRCDLANGAADAPARRPRTPLSSPVPTGASAGDDPPRMFGSDAA